MLQLRREWKETSPLGEYGAQAIRSALATEGLARFPHLNEYGAASLLGYTFPLDPFWSHRLVRAEVDLGEGSRSDRELPPHATIQHFH